MAAKQTFLVLTLFSAVFCSPDQQPSYEFTPPPSYEHEPAKYDFKYIVKDDYSGNNFGHQEARDGYDTYGSYYVYLPDGRLEKVSYSVSKDTGYKAEVSYEGEAHYPQQEYTQQAPVYV